MTPFLCHLGERGRQSAYGSAPFPGCHTVTEGHQGWPMETLTPFWEPLQHLAVSCAKHLGLLGSGEQ